MSKKKLTAVVHGSMNFDFVIKGERLPALGETVSGSTSNTFSGGKGANQAVQLARLGMESVLIGRLGKDEQGKFLIEDLKKSGVRTEHIIYDDAGTGVGCVMADACGDNYVMIIPNGNGRCTREDIDSNVALLEDAAIAITQLETTFEATGRFIEQAHTMGVPVILNPAPAKKLERYFFEKSYIITPNETEASFYTGVPAEEIATTAGCEEAAEKLLQMGAQRVVITLGRNGCYYSDGKQHVLSPAYKVDAVDTTAAGDAFNGALCYALAHQMPIEQALRLANAAGALAASSMGAQASLSDKQGIEEFLATQ